MNRTNIVLFGTLLLAASTLMAQNNVSQPSQPHASSKQVHAVSPNRGQQVFDQNCSRCHAAPDGFSPKISTAVAMHMRVRASLSDADYKALLRFLNP